MKDLSKQIALITGGSKGIGFGIAESLLSKGVNVAVTSRSLSSAKEAAKQLNTISGGSVLAIEADVRDLNSMHAAVSTVIDEWGKLDILIANAGLGHFAPIEDMTPTQWHETIDTNLTGVFYSVKAALAALKQSEGYIITLSSLAGTNFFPQGAAYNASKFGLTGFSQSIMLDLRHYGIKVTTIMPGSVASNFNNNEVSAEDAWKIQPEDLGKICVDLLKMHPRTLPSKIEVRPSQPPRKK